MPNYISRTNPSELKAYIITGPTSGIGRATTLEVIKHGTVVLVGRDREKLNQLQKEVERKGGHAVSVVCDLSDIARVRRAAADIIALRLPILGLLNNAGIMQMRAAKSARGWDTIFATNYLGPFALTEALIPHLPDGARVIFVASGVEDPERKPAKMAGFRVLAAAMAFAREAPRLRINAVEPGFTPNTGLGRDANASLRFVANYILPLLAPHIRYWNTPKRAARLETKVLTRASGPTGICYGERGHPMIGSVLARDPKFQDCVVAETRALLSRVISGPANA